MRGACYGAVVSAARHSLTFARRARARGDRSREPLELFLVREHFEEALLVGDGGRILEGTQTNFYAVMVCAMHCSASACAANARGQNGSIYTAGEGILAGTIRRLVLEACHTHGINVRARSRRRGAERVSVFLCVRASACV